MTTPNYDDWSEVINGPDTYTAIADALKAGALFCSGSCAVGWTDQQGTHYDVLFTLAPSQYGALQGGLRADDLFVSIMRVGCFGFAVANRQLHEDYIGEKLNVRGSTAKALAELIKGVQGKLLADKKLMETSK